MKLYTVVIHYLQMCMKEYGCCPKFGRGDNLTYTLKYVIFYRNHIPSCTSAGRVLQLCKVSFKSNEPLRRCCAYKSISPPPKRLIGFL
jgi:hypothetical protein